MSTISVDIPDYKTRLLDSWSLRTSQTLSQALTNNTIDGIVNQEAQYGLQELLKQGKLPEELLQAAEATAKVPAKSFGI